MDLTNHKPPLATGEELLRGATMTQEEKAFFMACKAIVETVKEAGEVPEGTIYAALMTKGLTLNSFEHIKGLLLSTETLKSSGFLMTPGPNADKFLIGAQAMLKEA
jgi:hypothetical protein